VRDLGGLPVGDGAITRRGLIYRGDSLDSITSSDKAILFDRRTPEEAGGNGLADARQYSSQRVYTIPIVPAGRIGQEPFPVGDPDAVADFYFRYVDERGPYVAVAISRIAESAEAQVPVLFHCAAGRDRTGVVAAVLLSLFGVEDSAIVADYLCSNLRAEQVTKRLQANALYRENPTRSVGADLADGRSMVAFLAALRTRFGNAREWIRQMPGTSDRAIDNLTRTITVAAARGESGR